MKKTMDTDFYYDEPDEIENEYLTALETMSLLYIGKTTFYKLVRSGELPAFRVGKQWRIKRETLEQWISAQLDTHV
jgi:excisionase family DNA binding protein